MLALRPPQARSVPIKPFCVTSQQLRARNRRVCVLRGVSLRRGRGSAADPRLTHERCFMKCASAIQNVPHIIDSGTIY
eukprot:21348-Eustigmatos_ZCMA.PRE.1